MKDFKLILIELFETEQFGKLKEAVQNCIEEKEGMLITTFPAFNWLIIIVA